MSHSQGTWRIVTGEDALPNRFAIQADGHRVCTVESYPSATTGLSDARLIATAPRLLVALMRTVHCLNEPGVMDVDAWQKECKLATVEALQAIEQATKEGK